MLVFEGGVTPGMQIHDGSGRAILARRSCTCGLPDTPGPLILTLAGGAGGQQLEIGYRSELRYSGSRGSQERTTAFHLF
jgi:hypothetical protein